MIQFSHVVKRYPGDHTALDDITLGIEKGELVFLTGHSGAGKSTLLKLIAAIERPTSGAVTVSGQNVGRLSRHAVPFLRRNNGLIFQDHKLLFDRNVIENTLLPLSISGFDRREALKRARAALDKVGLLNKERALPVTLSGGEQQRLCIARAVVSRPALVLYALDWGEAAFYFIVLWQALTCAYHGSRTVWILATFRPAATGPV